MRNLVVRAAAVGNVHEVDARALLQHLHGELVLAAVAARCVVQRRIGLARVLDEFREGLHRQRRIDREHELVGDQARDRREVPHRIDRHALVQVRIDRDQAVGAENQRVAIGGRGGDHLGSGVAVRAGAVLHHHRLAERFRELLPDDPRRDIRRAARRNGDDDAHGARRVGLPKRACCERGQEEKQESADFGCLPE